METKYTIATGIALQTHVLCECTRHHLLYFDDADPAPAFELALDLVHRRSARIALFAGDAHQLTDMICDVIGSVPANCPECRTALMLSWEARAAADHDRSQHT